MNLFEKKTDAESAVDNKDLATKPQKEEKRKFINKAKRKYSSYALAISAIVIAVAVGLNILMSVLADRVNLDIDISLKGNNTLTEENIEFLKTVDVPVTLTVCASRDSYINDLDRYTAQSLGVSQSGKTYYEQTVRFLDLYTKYNSNISVDFVDLQNPESAELIQKYSKYNINYGDIIVSAKHTVNGESVTRDSIVGYSDIYYIKDPYESYYGYSSGAYTVSGNYFEKAVSSAIRKVAATETIKAGVLSTHCSTTGVDYLTDMLKLNGYEISSVSDNFISELSGDLRLLIINAPTEDFAVSELEAIDTWLYNGKNRGRGILFFASATSPDLPNLYSYLEEWGISVGSGILFDTSDGSHLPSDPMTMIYTPSNESNDLVKTLTNGTKGFIGGTAVPLTALVENEGTISTAIPAYTYSESVAVAPIGSSTTWSVPSGTTLDRYAGVIVGKQEEYVDNVPKASYVVAFASPSFISESIAETYSSADNMYLALNAANVASGADTNQFSFYMKSLDSETYTVTEGSSKAITYIFQWGIPILLIACGVVVFVRRRRK